MRLDHRLLATALVWVLAAATARAEFDPGVLDRLDDPSFDARENASAALLGEETLDAAELAAVLPPPGERPEVRARLLDAMHHHFLRRLREEIGEGEPDAGAEAGLLERAGRAALRGPAAAPGSLGVSHRAFPPGAVPGMGDASIAVVRTLPGFPAHAALRAGDLIVSLNGRPVAWPEPAPEGANARNQRRRQDPRERLSVEVASAAAGFSTAIQTAGAGTSVTLGVVRGAERLEVAVTLARSESLQRLYPAGHTGAADAAWRERLEALLAEVDPPPRR